MRRRSTALSLAALSAGAALVPRLSGAPAELREARDGADGPRLETATLGESAAAPPRAHAATAPLRWGAKGHTLAARVAADGLPPALPAFFRGAADGLAYLNPEPDRWRSRTLEAMDQAWSYDHYIDLENVPPAAREAPDRFTYLRLLYDAGLEVPERDAGFLPFRIHELYQRLVTGWRLWRAAAPGERRWIELRILNDAGILGHYVTDASQPHHTTIHFNGWNTDAPNPRGFTYARDFHARFESAFVDVHVEEADVAGFARPGVRSVAGAARRAIWDHVLESHAQVERLYELEQEEGFDPFADAAPELRDFAARRLAAGADMLRTLWWSAWLESAEAAPEG